VVWWVLPKGRNAKEIFEAVTSGKVAPDKFAQYAAEIHRLFEKRAKAMDPALDARLSYSTDIGHSPNDLALPGWKAVFFNPKTDEDVIDRLVYSIEELA
jgi:L-2,4-diaminobutyrate decarboxylase